MSIPFKPALESPMINEANKIKDQLNSENERKKSILPNVLQAVNKPMVFYIRLLAFAKNRLINLARHANIGLPKIISRAPMPLKELLILQLWLTILYQIFCSR